MESLRTAGILLGQAWRRLENRGPYLLPLSAILLPVAYFLSIARPDAERTNKLINLAYLGGISLTIGMLTLGIGLRRGP